MFVLTRESSLPPELVWQRLAALSDHAEKVPLTTTVPGPGEPGVGWTFTVRTAVGPLRFDDSMVVEEWNPLRQWRIRKTGLLRGWAEAVVEPYAGGSRITWTEELWLEPFGLRRITTHIGDRLGPLLFGPVVTRIASSREAVT